LNFGQAVTEVNKRQYVHCLAKYLMVDRVAKQVEAFMEGRPLFYLSEDTGSEANTFIFFLWHAAILFIYFYINRADMQYLYILLVEYHSCYPHCFRSVEILTFFLFLLLDEPERGFWTGKGKIVLPNQTPHLGAGPCV
jgi:hypothetical protein